MTGAGCGTTVVKNARVASEAFRQGETADGCRSPTAHLGFGYSNSSDGLTPRPPAIISRVARVMFRSARSMPPMYVRCSPLLAASSS